MSDLDSFFWSEENRKKYGFEISKDANGITSIYYDGDIGKLAEIAYLT